MKDSSLERAFMYYLRVLAQDLPEPVRELVFCPGRRFRFDFAWTDLKVAVEMEGGIWKYGRHNRPEGFIRDLEKYDIAANLGWLVLRFTGDDLKRDPSAVIDKVRRALSLRKAETERT